MIVTANRRGVAQIFSLTRTIVPASFIHLDLKEHRLN